METLKKEKRLYDPECVSCHTVGMRYESGYRSLEQTPELAAVGCEQCHGPGLNHLINTKAPYQEIFVKCEACHDHEASPKFDQQREEYFRKIRHWDEPRRYWR